VKTLTRLGPPEARWTVAVPGTAVLSTVATKAQSTTGWTKNTWYMPTPVRITPSTPEPRARPPKEPTTAQSAVVLENPGGPGGPWIPCAPCAPCTPASPRGPRGPRLPLNARFALAPISTVWIVPFLMFFDVTTMVAAVAAGGEPNAAALAVPPAPARGSQAGGSLASGCSGQASKVSQKERVVNACNRFRRKLLPTAIRLTLGARSRQPVDGH
jgi:hypothetical protein